MTDQEHERRRANAIEFLSSLAFFEKAKPSVLGEMIIKAYNAPLDPTDVVRDALRNWEVVYSTSQGNDYRPAGDYLTDLVVKALDDAGLLKDDK